MADDNFPAVETLTAVGVADIEYTIIDRKAGADEMLYKASVTMSDGSVQFKTGSVIPHLTAQEIAGLQSLIARLRGKAQAAWGTG